MTSAPPPVQLGITLGKLNPAAWEGAAVLADRLGFESVWMSDHLAIPYRLDGQLAGARAEDKLAPGTPLFDPPSYLSFLAGRTSRVKLGTLVYLLGLRHPFVSARGFATLDTVSRGRALAGVGAGWLRSEFEVAGIDPAARGRLLDEAIGVVRRLWTDEAVASDGPFFPFEAVGFEPKPARPIPILVGGESRRALARAAEHGDGWLGMSHDPASAKSRVEELRELRARGKRAGEPFTITVLARDPGPGDLDAYALAGVDRVIVAPWRSSRTAEEDLRAYAAHVALGA